MDSIIIEIVVVIVVILFSMTLHEVMHGLTAYLLGDDTAKLLGRLTLNPIKHIDPFLTILLPIILVIIGGPVFGGAKPVPFNPARVKYDEWGAALVAIAGPLTNFMIAFLLFGVYVLLGFPDGMLGMIFTTAVLVNLGFFVFNMIPFPPLDGSRVMYALAPEVVRRGMEAIEQYGVVFVFAIVMLGSAVIGAFIGTTIDAIISLFMNIFAV